MKADRAMRQSANILANIATPFGSDRAPPPDQEDVSEHLPERWKHLPLPRLSGANCPRHLPTPLSERAEVPLSISASRQPGRSLNGGVPPTAE